MRTVKLLAVIVVMALAVGCTDDIMSEDKKTQDDVHSRLQEQVPAPEISGAAAREAVVRHLERWQSGDVVSYVTFFSQVGTPIGYYVAQGKIASTCQMLTAPDRVSGGGSHLRQAPALDGTYYTSDDCGIFFFTADSDAYVEWNGTYLVTDQPLPIDAPALEVASEDE